MDALSKIFDDIHLNHSEYIYLQAQGDWSFQSPKQDAVIAHIVLYGNAYLEFSPKMTVALQTGDMFLMMHLNGSESAYILFLLKPVEPWQVKIKLWITSSVF